MESEKRFIEANALIGVFEKIKNETTYPYFHLDEITDEIMDAPTVDAVEVVRCEECKNWKHFDHLGCTDFVKVCMLANYMIGENGYCLYGERKDHE